MKFRNKFVANSSSSCYILNLDDEWSKELLTKLKEVHVPKARGLGRGTGWAAGKDLPTYAADHMEYEKRFGYSSIGSWIQEWIDKLGNDKVLFVMESDEGMGGFLPLALDEIIAHASSCTDYH